MNVMFVRTETIYLDKTRENRISVVNKPSSSKSTCQKLFALSHEGILGARVRADILSSSENMLL